jgi:thiamine phosphate synthase YjbQ (UPF0047 family)
MKSHTEYLTFNLPSKMAFKNITSLVEEILKRSGIQEGLILVKPIHRSVLLDQPRPSAR